MEAHLELVGDILFFFLHTGWGILESDILILHTSVSWVETDLDIDLLEEIVKLVNFKDLER